MTTAQHTLADHDLRELQELIAEHSWLLDHGRWHQLADLYVDDGSLAVGPRVIQGREAFLGWADQRVTNPGRRTHHQCTNLRLARAANGTAEGTVMLVLHVSNDAQPAEIEFVGEYRDRYRRDAQGRWRFQHRALISISDPFEPS
ncbi:nuclear transport factor 2 family protein [Nocardia sp. NPDC052278]|uniref:nuclear transport factor 2 family protein n=1 Tax=unclassified Nocardia TaxID=2637762 RepID=UPI00369FE7A8